ncbi:hypothetical protein ABZT49_09190 [Methylobacterium sp. EM32]|uniref:hypothetical protein n=1 Tax=Methylobacterium sp. EM32 TaxID=3163481 RepID=UPI0033B741F8
MNDTALRTAPAARALIREIAQDSARVFVLPHGRTAASAVVNARFRSSRSWIAC